MSKDEQTQVAAVVSMDEAARLLGIGRGLAYRLAQRGELPTLRLGRRLVVPKVQLDAMLAGAAPERESEAV